jgi:hypothetical protein
LPALFGEELLAEVDAPGQLACLPMKKAGLTIHDPMETADLNYTASTVVCGHLVVALRGNVEFQLADHHSTGMAARKAETRKRNLEESMDLTNYRMGEAIQ